MWGQTQGPDKISAFLLKAAAPIIARPLTDLWMYAYSMENSQHQAYP